MEQERAVLRLLGSSTVEQAFLRTKMVPTPEDLRDATMAKYKSLVPDNELSQLFNGVDIDKVEEETRGIENMLKKALRYQEEMLEETGQNYSKTKFVYRHVSRSVAAKIPNREGHTTWELREAIKTILEGTMKVGTALDLFGVGNGTYGRTMTSLMEKYEVDTKDDLKRVLQDRNISVDSLVSGIEKPALGRPKLLSQEAETAVVVEVLSAERAGISKSSQLTSRLDEAVMASNPSLDPRNGEACRKHAARATSRVSANSRKGVHACLPEELAMEKEKLSALADAVLKGYRAGEVKRKAEQISNGYIFTVANKVNNADTSCYESLKDSVAYKNKEHLWLNAPALEKIILQQVTSACPDLEGSTLGVLQIILTKPNSPPQFCHLDCETPKTGQHEKLGTMVLTPDHPGPIYWDMDEAPSVVSAEELKKKWEDAPPELFERIQESNDASKVLQQYGHLFWADEANRVERKVVERHSITLLDSCQPHCGPSIAGGSPRVVLFFTLTPKNFQGDVRYGGGKQMSREKLTFKLYDALGETTQSKETDEYLISKFVEHVGCSARCGVQDATLMDWEATVPEVWKKMWEKELGAIMKSENKVSKIEKEGRKKRKKVVKSLTNKRTKLAKLMREIEEEEKNLIETGKTCVDKLEAAKDEAAIDSQTRKRACSS